MGKRAQRRICAQHGCRAWAMHGAQFCVAHRDRSAAQAVGDGVAAPHGLAAPQDVAGAPSPLQRLLAHSTATEVGSDLPLIDRELSALLDARHYFLSWVAELRAAEAAGLEGSAPAGGRAGAQPAQFLRAWNDSSARIVALLRARRSLAGGEEAFDALVDEIIAELDVPAEAPTADLEVAREPHDHAG